MSDQHLFENISEDWVKELEALDTRVTELIGETSLSPKNKKELQERVHKSLSLTVRATPLSRKTMRKKHENNRRRGKAH